MDQESWLSCEKTAVLQGGFLLANQLCQPEPLSAIKKEQWGDFGHPIVSAVTEICRQVRGGERKDGIHWRKKIICIVWSKLLEKEKGEDIDISWKENPLFAIQNSLPNINHTVLFELVKSMGFSKTYVELLLCFQPAALCREVERLVQHVTSGSTETDAQFLLEVWWELWKGRRGHEDTLDQAFSDQCARYARSATDLSPQASKRFKPDPDTAVPASGVVSILFHALEEIKDRVSSSHLGFFALSNCLDTFYTSYLLEHATHLPTERKLQSLSRAVTLRKRHDGTEGVDLVEVIREALRDLTATCSPSQFKPCGMTQTQAMETVLGLTRAWEERGLLKVTDSNDPCISALRLKDSLYRVLQFLEDRSLSETMVEEEQTTNDLKSTLKGVLASLSFPDPDSTYSEIPCVAVAIIDNHFEGFQDLPKLFASELIWAFRENEWMDCLERNKSAFQQKELVMKLVSTLIAKCQTDADVQQCKKLKDIIIDIFCALPLPDKNETLAEMLTFSKRGLHGSLPHAVTVGFTEELNLAFNCIIQGGAQSSLSAAISAIARVAFQNPEATMRRCCHLAVVNLGAHTLLARILQQLSGLGCQPGGSAEMPNNGGGLLCSCLLDTVWNKLSSPQEEDQLLHFLVALMEPNISGVTEKRRSFLPPEEALRAFVLPHLSASSPRSCSLELCLRLLQSALALESQDDSARWVMSCSPLPLLFCLCQLLNDSSRCWEEPSEDRPTTSMESKELLVSVLTTLGQVIGREVAQAPDAWSRALSWLYGKVETLDWTVRFRLKAVWGKHFKCEVPGSLLAVCELSEREWSGLKLPEYGQGTGLLAWVECCSLSDKVQETMLDSLSLDQHRPGDVNMFSKGLLVALSQTLPWCTAGEWGRLLQTLRELLRSGRLHTPYSVEYVDFLPLLDLRSFACELRLSVLLLRVFQLLCGSSCADWLPPRGWAHAGRLYASAMRETIDVVKGKLPLPSGTAPPGGPEADGGAGAPEVLFVLTQLFCHVLHVQVMMPVQAEALFLCALEILSHYEATLAAHPKSSSPLERDNTRHFLTTITDNLECAEMKAVLHQKIAQL